MERSSAEMSRVVSSFFSGQPYKGVVYSNLQMYGPNISEDVDPDCLIKPVSFSTFWPGGIQYAEQRVFGSFLLAPSAGRTDYSKISQIRKTLLSLELSKRALRRWSGIKADYDATYREPEQSTNDWMVPVACEVSNVPFASAVLSEVISHRRITAGQTIAHLYFPAMMNNPRLALQVLQATQRNVITEEQLH